MINVAVKEHEREAMRYAASVGLPHIDLERFPIVPEAMRQIPREEAERLQAVCFFLTQDELRLGAVDPAKDEIKELAYQLGERNHANTALYVISEHSLEKALQLYDSLPVIKPISKEVTIPEEEINKVQADVNDFHALQDLIDRTATTDVVTFLLGAALKLSASDVHVEAEADKVAVRLRLDGILHDAATLDKEAYHKFVSRIKLVASLKLNVSERPQDGRFTIHKTVGGDVDVRVSTMPTVHGESVVMRLLPRERKGLDFTELGLTGRAFEKLQKEISRPNGMIITTGPTGSGKTTTLYAVMETLNKPGVKIITLEDPVEYRMAGINQSQVDVEHGYTFAKGLKSMLRQDPDIAMVGEIRDLETADTAIQAALTGHLLLSTLHTNSAAGAIPRFIAMGVRPFLLAPALNAVIGQRLVRRLCSACRKEKALTENELADIQKIISVLPLQEKKNIPSDLIFYGPIGCEECNGLGYKGRVGVYEIMVVDDAIEKLILAGTGAANDVEAAARSSGMLTMVEDGVLKALAGMTSLEEVFRVLQ